MPTWQIVLAWLGLAFHAGTIAYLIARGRPDNSLHASALSWAYLTAAGILAGIGFGALTPLLAPGLLR